MGNERLQVTFHNNLNTPGHVRVVFFPPREQKQTVGHVIMAIKLIKLRPTPSKISRKRFNEANCAIYFSLFL